MSYCTSKALWSVNGRGGADGMNGVDNSSDAGPSLHFNPAGDAYEKSVVLFLHINSGPSRRC